MSLNPSLQTALTTHGPMTFAEYMQQALYSPEWGYYNRSQPILGRAGDFITAPELTPLFGYALANQCEAILKQYTHPVLFEFGAGSGQLCIDILTHLDAEGACPEMYHILEPSGALRALQQHNITEKLPEHLVARVQWHTTLPETPFEGVIIANEVLDAMPVHRFLKTETDVFESMIGLDENNQLIETFEPCQNEMLKKHVNHIIQHDQLPYASEANLAIQPWINTCFSLLKRGVVLLIDYGFPQHEYYHPDRHQGTLMCHYQHKAHANPLLHPGDEDITAHVDFTHVADSALNAGFHVAGYTNQAAFLLGNGLLDLTHALPHEGKAKIRAEQAIKKLLQPHEMGELFKVMGLSKALDMPLNGFTLHDKRASLDA